MRKDDGGKRNGSAEKERIKEEISQGEINVPRRSVEANTRGKKRALPSFDRETAI
jgi:hypothetical protein